MVENELCRALRGLIGEAVKDLLLPTESKELREPKVVLSLIHI